MAWPVDTTKLDRARTLMKDQGVTALVCRAPDNVLYLTNYWCMKGYDAVVFPQKGEATLIALELNMGTQSADRMVGEPTTFMMSYFDSFKKFCGQVVDATPLLNEARSIKTAQEVERMRLANELAALAMDYTRANMKPGMKESEVGAMYEGFVHGIGVGHKGKVEMARAFTLVWSGKGIATFTATGDRPIQKNEPTLFEIWVCADGYWT